MIWEMKWKDSKPGGLYDKFIELEGSNKKAQNWNFWAFTINQWALDSVLLLVPGTGYTFNRTSDRGALHPADCKKGQVFDDGMCLMSEPPGPFEAGKEWTVILRIVRPPLLRRPPAQLRQKPSSPRGHWGDSHLSCGGQRLRVSG